MARPVVLADLTTFDPSTGYHHLRGVQLAGVELLGPAVVAVTGNFVLRDCELSAPLDLLFRRLEPDEAVPVGAIIGEGVTIERCSLRAISFLALDGVIQAVAADLLR